MTVSYFLHTHGRPAPIYRLIRTIRRHSPASLILIGHESTSGALDLGPVADIARLTLLNHDRPAPKGSFGGLRTYLDGIAELGQREPAVDWVVHLSAQDYPVRPLWQLEEKLATAGADGFMPHWDALAADGPWGRSKRGLHRYYFQYWTPAERARGLVRLLRVFNDVQSLVHVHEAHVVRLGVRARARPFSPTFRCFAGGKFHILSGRAVRYLDQTLRANPDLLAYYRRTIAPEESLVQTVLLNSGRFRFSTEAVRFADQASRRDGHARRLTSGDLQMLWDGGYYLARRFDAEADPGILDRLDAHMGLVPAGTGA